MEMVEEQMPASHPPGDGQTLRLFDGTTWAFRCRGEGYTLVEVLAPPGAGPPPHTHRDQDETIHVLEGEFSFVGEGGARTLGAAGSSVSVPRGTVHAFKVVGGGPGRCLVVLTPPGGYERFVEEVGAPVSDGAPDAPPGGLPGMGEVLECARRNGIEMLVTPV